jgi:hypothetical protein
MIGLNVGRYDAFAAALVLLTGCGGSQPTIGAPGVMSQSLRLAPHAAPRESWMRPEALSEDLLYVADGGELLVFSYPSGILVGTIAGNFEDGICSDKSGNVFATDRGDAKIYEFPHGSLMPSAILHFPNNAHQPIFCAVDPNTGNLAVTLEPGPKYAGIALFTAAKGRPKYYYYTNNYSAFLWACTYDLGSNLFVATSGGNSLLTELPKCGGKFQDLKLKCSGGFSGPPIPLQLDGKYVTVGSQTGSTKATIYRLKLTGTSLSIVGRTTLNAYGVLSTWFEPGTLIGTSSSGVSLWKYPAGGYPFLRLPSTVGSSGVTVSLAPK